MIIVVLPKSIYKPFLSARLEKIKGNNTVYIITKNDITLDRFNNYQDRLACITQKYGNEAYLFLHDRDIYGGVRPAAGRVNDRTYTFHHEKNDRVYKHLFLDDYQSVDDLVNAIVNNQP